MKAKKLECFTVNGKVFIVDEAGILRQCKLLPETVTPTFAEYEAIFKKVDEE